MSSCPALLEWSDRRRERGGGRSRTSVCSAFSPGPHLSDSDPAPPSGLSEHGGTCTRNSYEIQIPSIESGLYGVRVGGGDMRPNTMTASALASWRSLVHFPSPDLPRIDRVLTVISRPDLKAKMTGAITE